MSRARFVVFILSCFLLIAGFGGVAKVKAETPAGSGGFAQKVGTHLYNFDPGGQLKALNKLADSGLPSNYPIVLMVDANEPNSYRNLAQAASGGNFFPIVRIVGISPSTNLNAMGQVANFIMANFKAGTPVELGNEINSPSEWNPPDFGSYGKLFDALAGALSADYPLGIAAMDTSNSEHDAMDTLNALVGKIQQINRITAVFANTYKLSSCKYAAVRCSTGSAAWARSAVMSTLGAPITKLYVTEYGTKDCINKPGDYDCLQDFYENNPIDANAVVGFASTPGDGDASTKFEHTVPAICEYWALDTLEVHTPKKCNKKKKNDVGLYYGIEDQIGSSLTETFPKEQEVAAHYMLTCGSQFDWKGEMPNEGQADRETSGDSEGGYVKEHDCKNGSTAAQCMMEPTGTLTLDNSKTTIPLFRYEARKTPDLKDPQRRVFDLEGFFAGTYKGQNLSSAGNDIMLPLGNGVGQKIGSDVKCRDKVEFIRSVNNLCGNNTIPATLVNNEGRAPQPEESSVCGFDSKIPDLNNMTYSDIYRSKPGGFTCETAEGFQEPAAWQEFRRKLNYVEITTPRAFRPAYIVRYTTYPDSEVTKPVGPPFLKWFSAVGEPGSITRLKNRIKVIRVWVPANGTTHREDLQTPIKERSEEESIAIMSPYVRTVQTQIPKDLDVKIRKRHVDQIEAIHESMTQQGANLFTLDPLDPPDNSEQGPFKTSPFIWCPECLNNQTALESVIVARINAEIQLRQSNELFTLDPNKSSNIDCSLKDLVGEKAKQLKHGLDNYPEDPIKPIDIVTKARLWAQKIKDPVRPMMTRTYMLLPEEFRNVTDYESHFVNQFLGKDIQQEWQKVEVQNKDVNAAKTLAKGKTVQVYRYLMLSDSKYSFLGPNKAASKRIGYDWWYEYYEDAVTGKVYKVKVTKDVVLYSRILGDTPYNPEPQVPGGILARGLWEILCHVSRPMRFEKDATGKAIAIYKWAPYGGLEKLFQKGINSCYEDSPTPITAGMSVQSEEPALDTDRCMPAEGAMECYNWRPESTCDSTGCGWVGPASDEAKTGCTLTGGTKGHGQRAGITSGVVKLALEISQYTCTPAEMIIGVLAKESSGRKPDGSLYSGDPAESISCPDDGKACGPYRWVGEDYVMQVQKYGAPFTYCLEKIGMGGDMDRSKLGVAMCGAAAKMWRGLSISAGPGGSPGSEYGCDHQSHALSEFSERDIVFAANTFHGSQTDGVGNNYLSFIDQYKFYVQQIKDEIGSCLPN